MTTILSGQTGGILRSNGSFPNLEGDRDYSTSKDMGDVLTTAPVIGIPPQVAGLLALVSIMCRHRRSPGTHLWLWPQ